MEQHTMADTSNLTPAHWVANRAQWELTAPSFRVPSGQDPDLLTTVIAQHAVSRQVLEHLRTSDATQCSTEIALALAGVQPLTFATCCELITLFGPDAFPTPAALAEAIELGIGSTVQLPDSHDSLPAGISHPDADVAISGLLLQLGPVIDRWAGERVAAELDVDIEVFVGQGRANLVVAGGLFNGQMWLPEDWGVRAAEEVYTPDGTFVVDQIELNEYPYPPAIADVRVYPVLHHAVHDNPAYLPFVSRKCQRREHPERGVYYAAWLTEELEPDARS
jgi:hypothetical protein